MKKTKIITAIALGAMLSGCKSAYEKYTSDEFSLEYPAKWDKEIKPYPIMPFVTFSEYQTATVSTKINDTVTVEEFAKMRVEAFSEEQIGFELIDLKMDGEYALIRYANKDEESAIDLGTLMKIGKRGNKLYGITCSYENQAQQDTVEHIISSFQLK